MSLSVLGTRSAVLITATRRSTFWKSSMAISSGVTTPTFFFSAFFAFGASFGGVFSDSTSMRGKMGCPFMTFVPSEKPPYFTSLRSKFSGTARPSCSKIFGAVKGIIGEIRMAILRTASARLYITASRRSFCAGSLARIHGVVTSMYLLAAPI